MMRRISEERAANLVRDYETSGDSMAVVAARHSVGEMTAHRYIRKAGVRRTHRMAGEVTHGRSRSREYRIWASMLNRCTNRNAAGYVDYGAKGITVCDKWTTFAGFFEDMGEAPSDSHMLERGNGLLGYFKENCRWATRVEQNSNTNRNVIVSANGESLTVAEWARRLGVGPGVISMRIRRGWPPEKAVTTPQKRTSNGPSGRSGNHRRKNNVMLTLGGETLCLAEWAKRLGATEQAIKNRLKRGWSMEEALGKPFRGY